MSNDAVPEEPITEIFYEHVPEADVFDKPIDRYRYLVGRTVQTMAEVDYLLANVIAELVPSEAGGDHYWGQSGDRLVEGLDRAMPYAGSEATALRMIRGMYSALYKDRNDVVHGFYDGPEGPGSERVQTIRLEKASKKSPGLRHLPKLWHEWQLASLAKDASGLVDDAVMILYRLQRPDAVRPPE